MALRDTVLINGWDIMFDDVNLKSDKIDPFFFKINIYDYLKGLIRNGWDIYFYWPALTKEYFSRIPRSPQYLLPDLLMEKKKETIDVQIRIQFLRPNIIDLKPNQKIQDVLDVTKFSPTSFAIMDADREFDLPIARYTAEEIFGFNDPPTIEPDTIYMVLPSSYQFPILQYFPVGRVYAAGPTITERSNLAKDIIQQYPRNNIVQAWQVVFRYPKNIQTNYIDYTENFQRPDLDVVPIAPGARLHIFTIFR